jgi:hypothetical protein
LSRKVNRTKVTEMRGFSLVLLPLANDASSATRPAGRVDCNQSVMAGFAAAHG